MNKKNIIIAIITVIIVAFGAFLLWEKSPAPLGSDEISQEQGREGATTTTPALVVNQIKKKTTVPAQNTTSAGIILKDGSYLVSYTDHGFVPAMIEINAGKSVHFVNNSNKAMSLTTTNPDSNMYGEFNQSKTVGKGGTYDFVFLQPGVWGYINRNNHLDGGTIIVK